MPRESIYTNEYLPPTPEDLLAFELWCQQLKIHADFSSLVPSELAQQPFVQGNPELFVNQQSHGGTVLIVVDDEVMAKAALTDNFAHLDASDLEDVKGLERKVKGQHRLRRVLFHASLGHITDEILLCGMIDIHKKLQGKGLGVAFHRQLCTFAKEHGYRFICGFQNDAKLAQFFVNRGRYLIDDIKPEYQAHFAPALAREHDHDEVFMTIMFLNEGDAAEFVRADRLDVVGNERVAHSAHRVEVVKALESAIYQTNELPEKFPAHLSDRISCIVGILDQLDMFLPPEESANSDVPTTPISTLCVDLPATISKLRDWYVHLKARQNSIVEVMTNEDAQELAALRTEIIKRW